MKSNKLKKIIAIVIASTMVATIAPVTASAAWLKDSQNNWNWIENGNMSTGWKQVDGTWYHFDANGKMQTGWVQTADSKWYYMNSDGAMKSGWLQTGDGKWYNLAPSGEMKTGWIKDTSGKWYFTDTSGAMQTGIVEIQGKVYLLEASGAMATGSTVIGGETYTIDANGAIVGDKLPIPDKAFTNQGTVTTPNVTPTTDTTGTTIDTTITDSSSSSSSSSHNHSSNSNTISVSTINTTSISGVTAPVTGVTPVSTIDATQYTATVTWSGTPTTFAASTSYTATIIITPKLGYTLSGVAANQFTVARATTVTNAANSGVVTAVFPATAATFAATTNNAIVNDVATLGLVGKTATLGDSTIATATIINGKVAITSVKAGTTTITVSDGTNSAAIDVTVNADGTITIGTITKYVAGTLAVTITSVTVSKNPNAETANIGDVLTLTVNMSDGQLAGNRVKYFAVIRDTEDAIDGIDIEVKSDSNKMIIPSTYMDNDGNTQSIIGKYIDFGAEIINAYNSGQAESVGPIGVTVVKETLVTEMEVSATSVIAGHTLADSTLNGSFKNVSHNMNVSGTLVWDEPTTVVNATGDFGWTFTPDDTTKYNVVTGTISVTVVSAINNNVEFGNDYYSNIGLGANTNTLKFTTKGGLLIKEIDTTKLSYSPNADGTGAYALNGSYTLIDNPFTSLNSGEYSYMDFENGETYIQLHLTDLDANAIKNMQGYGNTSKTVQADTDYLYAEDGWYEGATGGHRNITINNLINITNNSTHTVNAVYNFINGVEYSSSSSQLSNGQSYSYLANSVADSLVIYEGSYTPNVTPRSGYMKIIKLTPDIILNGITIDYNGWIAVDSSNFGQDTAESDINITTLTEVIAADTIIATNAVPGTAVGNYAQDDIDIFTAAIAAAQLVVGNTSAAQEDVETAVAILAAAKATFEGKVVVETPVVKTTLIEVIAADTTIVTNAVPGTAVGNYAQADIDTFTATIAAAQLVVDNTSAAQEDVETAVATLAAAKATFEGKVVS